MKVITAGNMLVTLAQALRARGLNCVVGVFHNRHQPHLEIVGPAGNRAGGGDHSVPRRPTGRRFTPSGGAWTGGESNCCTPHGYKADLYGFLAAHGRWPVVATCHNWTGQGPALKMYGCLDRLVAAGFFDRVAAVSIRGLSGCAPAGVSARQDSQNSPTESNLAVFIMPAPTLAEEIGKGDACWWGWWRGW